MKKSSGGGSRNRSGRLAQQHVPQSPAPPARHSRRRHRRKLPPTGRFVRGQIDAIRRSLQATRSVATWIPLCLPPTDDTRYAVVFRVVVVGNHHRRTDLQTVHRQRLTTRFGELATTIGPPGRFRGRTAACRPAFRRSFRHRLASEFVDGEPIVPVPPRSPVPTNGPIVKVVVDRRDVVKGNVRHAFTADEEPGQSWNTRPYSRREIERPMLAALVIWILAASMVTAIVYVWDKRSAVRGRSRVPENVLLALSVAGGWPGGLAAETGPSQDAENVLSNQVCPVRRRQSDHRRGPACPIVN